jgi:hypothetical protein
MFSYGDAKDATGLSLELKGKSMSWSNEPRSHQKGSKDSCYRTG